MKKEQDNKVRGQKARGQTDDAREITEIQEEAIDDARK